MSYVTLDSSTGKVEVTVTSHDQHIRELKERIDELEAEVQELRHKSISDHATIVVLESFIAGIDPDLLDPKEEVFWEELHKKYYPEHYGR